MKKIKFLILPVLLVLLCSFTFLIVSALSSNTIVGSKGLTYHLSDDGTYYIVSDYNYGLSEPDLVIPEEHNGLPVKEIANDAFTEKKWLKSVYIPKSITKIGHGAFSQTGITKVYFNAENCQDFDSRNWVFYPNTAQATSIDVIIGKDVKKVPNRLFYPLSTIPTLNPIIKSITFEEGCIVSSIGDYAFYNIDETATITFPNSLKTIGEYAFYGNNFTSINFNDSLEVIDAHAFDNSKQITSLTFPNSIKEVKDSAFRNCFNLESVSSESPLYKVISKDTFKYCTKLTNINLNNVEEIGEAAFKDCDSLKIVDFPNLNKICKKAFEGCDGLTKITLDTKLSVIEDEAFYDCKNVNEIVIKSANLSDLNASNNAFYNCGTLTTGIKVNVLEGVSKLPKRLFLSTSNTNMQPNIKEIVINSSTLKLIDDYAFASINATVTYVGTKTMWSNVKVNIGNDTFARVYCVKSLEVE